VFFYGEAGRDGVEGGVGVHLRRVEVHLLPPHEPGLRAALDDLLKETPEDGEAEAFTSSGEIGVVGQGLVKVVAQVPAHGEPVGRNAHQLPLRSQPLEEEHELQLEEDHGVHGRPAAPSVEGAYQVPDEGEIHRGFEPPVEAVYGNQLLQRDIAG
jgi:hypothetical protein